jgi:uncharacterized protein YkwD
MRKQLPGNILLLALMISACGSQPPAETALPTPAETRAATESATMAPAETEPPPVEAGTATPETPVPTNAADCTNSAAFVSDVTIADNEIIPSSRPFTKTWRIKNTGTCIWGPEYTLTHYSGDRMFAPPSVPLSVTFPNQTVEISMELIAPKGPGTYSGYFVIKNPAGLIMKVDNDSRLWVIVNVEAVAATDPTAAQNSGGIPVTGGEGGFANAACAFTTDAGKVTETINAINAYRAQNGLPAYTVNDLLTKAAAAHANDMACNKLFVHTGSDGSTAASRVAASGYTASSVTENVYGSYPPLSGQGAVDWWKNDKTEIKHNLNLLSQTYTEIGVGYSYFNNFGYYVLVFAKPR